MTRWLSIALVALALLVAGPRPAAADITGFWGWSPTPATRSLKGFAIGIHLLVVGFEFEYAQTREDELKAAPSLTTGTFNALVSTPSSSKQIYLTAGAGVFREGYRGLTETNIATSIGGGLKIGLAGPIRVRIDYRLFALRGDPLFKTPQRFYAGLNMSF